MRWTQLAVITFIAIQQIYCQIQVEYQVPLMDDVEETIDEGMEAPFQSYYVPEPDQSHRHFSSLYNVGKHPKKITKMIKVNDENEIHLSKRHEISFTKRSKKKAALLVGGGAVVGALAMKHFSKPNGGGSAAPSDPNAGV